MTAPRRRPSPLDVAGFHAAYDVHPDDRVRLFRSVSHVVAPDARTLYPGSYVDIAPSVWFGDVTYVDVDKRAGRFFGQTDAVAEMVAAKRRAVNAPDQSIEIAFHHLDYNDPLPEPDGSFDLLVSLYAGPISEPCARYLRIGGTLFVNPSHGDVALASLDGRFRLSGVVVSEDDDYRIIASGLESYLIPKEERAITADAIRQGGRGVAYTRAPFAYLFTRVE